MLANVEPGQKWTTIVKSFYLQAFSVLNAAEVESLCLHFHQFVHRASKTPDNRKVLKDCHFGHHIIYDLAIHLKEGSNLIVSYSLPIYPMCLSLYK